MPLSSINTVAVVGTGVIGSSWTALFLSHGKKVLVCDPAEGAEDRLRSYLKDIWEVLPKTEDASIDHLTFVGASFLEEHLQSVDFVQENGPERGELKTKLIASLDAHTARDVPICSSSSGLIPSSFIGECRTAPERIMVGHPWNPPHIMPLVEIVPHPKTSPKVIAAAKDFYIQIGKKPIVLRKEVPGFIGNRLAAAVIREVFNLIAGGICEPEDIEMVMLNSLGPRWALTGPLMTNILGGGGNPGGFTRISTHLGPATSSWLKDMEERQAVEQDDEKKIAAAKKIEAGLGKVDTKALEKERNELMIELLRLRAEKATLEGYAVGGG